jgi:hypothetical protein
VRNINSRECQAFNGLTQRNRVSRISDACHGARRIRVHLCELVSDSLHRTDLMTHEHRAPAVRCEAGRTPQAHAGPGTDD